MKLLEINSLDLAVPGKNLIKNFNLTVNNNERWGILGPNGIGKSTFLYAMMGLNQIHAGSINICEKKLETYSAKSLAKIMGILFQDYKDAFPITVMESVMAGRYPHMKSWSMYSNEDIKIVEEILKLVNLSDKAYRYINTLSGGERRRVAVATLIVQSPMIWLLDEPTNHLDMHYQINMLDLLIERVQKSNGALLMVLHDVNLLIRYCTHAILMIDSNKIITGKVEDVINRENLQVLYNHPVKQIADNNKQMFFPG